MKVVGLVSGGKDSCYVMMRCLDYGHQIVALANLLPVEDSVDELDSYMYQTVGHQIIVTYAQCMGIPLFRRRIHGTPRHQELKYVGTQGDEVEDLLILLSEVKKQIPSIEGVSSGAIASDYQRLRVENICSRLGLVSLAFLWKQEQSILLQEMIEKGIEAILVKVASIGLHPNRHLGRDLTSLQPHLLHLKELYGIHVCGEGGEYETLTLDCPLFKNSRIVIDKFQIVLHSSDSIAPVGILHPSAFHLEPKIGNTDPQLGYEKIPVNRSMKISVIEVEGNNILGDCKNNDLLKTLPEEPDANSNWNFIVSNTQSDIFSIGCWVQISPQSVEGLGGHLGIVLKGVQCRLKEDRLGWEDVLYIHLYLSDMNQFAVANDTYLRYITEENCPCGVPSRSTIEIPLIEGGLGKAFVEVIVAKDKTKKVLHVQSISCWAPSCIGPYSQATLHRQILYMAGQLGLDPPTMTLAFGGAGVQMQYALINCEAVAKAFGCSLVSSLISLTVYCPAFLTSCEKKDIADSLEKFMEECTPLDDYSSITTKTSRRDQTPFLYILASMLPKGALVEVKPVLYIPVIEEDNESEVESSNKATCGEIADINEDEGFTDDNLTSSCCESFDVCGHICAATVILSSEAIDKICTQLLKDIFPSQSNNIVILEQMECLINIARFCIHALHKRLQKACLSWKDVLNFRVYFVPKVISIDKLRVAFKKAAEQHQFKRDSVLLNDWTSYESLITSFVPVLGVGRNTEMVDIIACELFASRF